MAYRGKLVTVQEALGEAPNGSGFVLTLGPAPGLDATNLVVGRVVNGMDLVLALPAHLCYTPGAVLWWHKNAAHLSLPHYDCTAAVWMTRTLNQWYVVLLVWVAMPQLALGLVCQTVCVAMIIMVAPEQGR